MLQTFTEWLLDPAGLTPHGFCLLWEPWLIWAHAASNIAIAVAYFSIPVALVVFARRRKDLVYKPVFLLFAAFILLCGLGHLADLLTLWVPAYALEAGIKVATAIVSVVTAAALWPLLPHLLALPSPAQLRTANQALAESGARYQAGFLRSPMPLHLLDTQGTITGVSDRWLDLLGYRREEVVGQPIQAFQEAESNDRCRVAWEAVLAGHALRDAERRLVRRDGQVLDVLLSAQAERAPDGTPWVLGAMVDVTARRRAETALRESEERLRQTQKMEVLGQLAGGVAHDFNNVLQAVSGGVALIQRRAERPDEVQRLAGMVAESAARGAATTRRLLAFARRSELQAAPVEPARLLQGLREFLAHTLGAGVTVAVEVPEGVPTLLADRGELETVLVNLATNARDAMPEGGILTFSAAAGTVSADAARAAGVGPGDYVRLTVSDTGQGMDAATLARATEPFFTTKPVDRGTGLGLAMARGFAVQSGGGLVIASAPGQGTTVTLWLPRAAEEAVAPLPRAGEEPRVTGARRATVLLVDDEPLVRGVLADELEERGYRVTQAVDAETALRALDAGTRVDLLVTDLSMPGMDGLTLIHEARQRRPGLRAILLTGNPGETSVAVSGAVSGAFSLLRKPVGGAELAARAASLLEGAEAT